MIRNFFKQVPVSLVSKYLMTNSLSVLDSSTKSGKPLPFFFSNSIKRIVIRVFAILTLSSSRTISNAPRINARPRYKNLISIFLGSLEFNGFTNEIAAEVIKALIRVANANVNLTGFFAVVIVHTVVHLKIKW